MAATAPCKWQPCAGKQGSDFVKPLWMPGYDYDNNVLRQVACQRIEQQSFLAFARAGEDENFSIAKRSPEDCTSFKKVVILLHVEFQVSGNTHALSAKQFDAVGIRLALRAHRMDALECWPRQR